MDENFGLCVILTSTTPFSCTRHTDFYDLSKITLFEAVNRILSVDSLFFDKTKDCEMTLSICVGRSSYGSPQPDLSGLLFVASHTGTSVSVERDLLGLDYFKD